MKIEIKESDQTFKDLFGKTKNWWSWKVLDDHGKAIEHGMDVSESDATKAAKKAMKRRERK